MKNENILTPKGAAEYIGFSENTLKAWRTRGEKPPYIKVNRSVRYKKSDLDAFLLGDDPKVVTSTQEISAPAKKAAPAKKFIIPTEEHVHNYGMANGLNLTGFFDFYESNGWKVGKNNMKNWRAAASGWSKRQGPKGKGKVAHTRPVEMLFPDEKEINPIFGE